ncbi:hypothetical protein ILYODFUR_038045 [Ilyodon furcidens]|uniref:Uncharacterized protein n=1 Tax=Ilyodon furcidens TaxID=33524 RepID=A0ABV0STY2_9TELE
MINQLQEAVELLQNPSRLSTEQDDLSEVQLYPVEMVTVEESFNVDNTTVPIKRMMTLNSLDIYHSTVSTNTATLKIYS